MGDDQKETRKSSFFSCFFPLSSCLFPDSSPLEITGKKAWLILCNFTFMFSFSRRILSWFVLVDVLIAMAEITFNCSSLKKKKKALKLPVNKIKKHKANTKKPTLLRGKAKYKLFKNNDCFQSHFETSTSGEKIWICLVFLFFLDKAQSLSFWAFRLDLEQEAFFTCASTFKVHDSSGVHRGGRFNQSRWHLDPCVMTQPCHTLWLLLINMSYRSSGVEWYVLTEMSYMPFWQNECVSSACVWMWL